MADIVHRIGIKAPAAQVYEAVSTRDGVAGWWTRNTSGGPAAASLKVQFLGMDGREIGQMDFAVRRAAPGRRVEWRFTDGPPEWVGTEVTFDLVEEGGMTVVIFGHRHWREPVEFMAHCSMKWAVFLLSLRSLLETGTGCPAPQDLKIDNWN